VFGRWVAVTVADYWWADALGAAPAFADVTALRLSLFLWVFSTALLWCTGNLYLVYRSIGSVHVPRRLANIEIVEAVPRSYLAAAVMVVGAILAFAISHNATEWWVIRAVADTQATVGLTDPILGREAAYYLFRLPWHRLLHGFSTLGAGLMLGIVLLLYVAVGAVRFAGRRLEVSGMARRHLGGLLAAFAAALVWGYRLEPVEFVAGLQNVPLDAVLTEVRLPTSRLLSALGLMALVTSLLWMRYDRLAIPVFGWVALVTFSLVGHYVVPAVAARARPSERGPLASLAAVERDFRAVAFGVTTGDTLLMTTGNVMDSAMIRRAPVWDGFAATVVFNRLQTDSARTHVVNAALNAARAPNGTVYPVYIGVPEIDLAAARRQRELSWESVHAGQLISARGVYAIRADTMTADGLPLYLGVAAEPEDAEARPRHLRSVHRALAFGVGTSEYAVVADADAAAAHGIPVAGIVRRLALAWRLQTPRFLGPNTVANDRVAVWERDVRRRLERLAPFAEFGAPFPVIVDASVQWVAYGYVSREGFPLAPPVAWRDDRVRYLRVGFVGVVDAHTGATDVYLMPDADLVSRALAERFPEMIGEADQLSPDLVDQLPYPSEWFDRQVRLVRDPQMRERFPGFFQLGAPPSVDSASTRKAWWVGPAPGDTMPRLRLRAAIQRGDPPALSALVDATMRAGHPRLVVYRLRAPYDEAAPGEAASQFALLRGTGDGISGVVRTVPFDAGLLHYQAYYETPGDGQAELPRLREVHASWKQGVGVGQNLWDAWDRARALVPADRHEPAPWATARRWLLRLDEARRRGDWDAFGDAYQALMELFELPRDSGG
jgi:hypothetical protein